MGARVPIRVRVRVGYFGFSGILVQRYVEPVRVFLYFGSGSGIFSSHSVISIFRVGFGYFYTLGRVRVFLVRIRLFRIRFGYLDFEKKSYFFSFLKFLVFKNIIFA